MTGPAFRSFPLWEGWAEANPYSSWTEPADNATWDQVMAGANALVQGEGGTGKTWLSKVRIGDETATSYDDATQDTLLSPFRRVTPSLLLSKATPAAMAMTGTPLIRSGMWRGCFGGKRH